MIYRKCIFVECVAFLLICTMLSVIYRKCNVKRTMHSLIYRKFKLFNVLIYWLALGLGLVFRLGLGLVRARVRTRVRV